MPKHPVYTIGHGTRKIEDLIEALQRFGIRYLVDVRSRPYSRFNPQYNQKALQESLKQHDITYIFMGDTLGGRPTDPGCYDLTGKVDYEKVKTKDFFQQGITRIEAAYQKDVPLALMCSESKPADCHRSRLIGQVLFANGIPLQHINESYELRTQEEVMKEIKKDKPGPDLFTKE
jgi:uncharacterized protein (DUF488 family)